MKKFSLNGNNEEELKKSAQEYAESIGIRLNPDEKIVNIIIKSLIRNKEKNGNIYCPCRLITKDKKKDEEIICPCVFHRGEIEIQKFCHCRLFSE